MNGKETDIMHPLVKTFKRNQRLYKDVKKWAEGFDKKITNWSYYVGVTHEDSTCLYAYNSFPVEVRYCDEIFYVLFTEHFGIHVFFKDDLIYFKAWRQDQSGSSFFSPCLTYDHYKLTKTRKGKFKVTNAQ